MNYYNENDAKAADWLRELIKANLIAPGIVDERSIVNVPHEELAQYRQCHFFAGIGGWSYALRLAGWPDDEPVWTGSCPCQPFSDAGKGLGEDDERHLWPDFRNLIGKRRPPVVFGEQVASADGREWLNGVSANLEALAYRFAAADLCAAGVKSPMRRQRLFWVAFAAGEQREERFSVIGGESCPANSDVTITSVIGGLAYAEHSHGGREQQPIEPGENGRSGLTGGGTSCGLVQSSEPGLEGHARDGDNRNQPGRLDSESSRSVAAASGIGAWDRFDILPFRDGKQRRVEAGTFPLAHGVSNRVGLLRGYGNAIVPQLAAEFIQAAREAIRQMI